MDEIKIEKGIPTPTVGRILHSKYLSTLTKMNVGDSIVLTRSQTPSVQQSISHYKKRINPEVRFTTRKISETETRVWRIK